MFPVYLKTNLLSLLFLYTLKTFAACDRWTETESMTVKVERGLLEGKFPELVKSFEAASQSSKKSSGKTMLATCTCILHF